jgi:hypothetical protein
VSDGVVAARPGSRPGDFPLGSIASRAAARALAVRLRESQEPIRIIVEHIGFPERDHEIVVNLNSERAFRDKRSNRW